jgi:hypothetical protein
VKLTPETVSPTRLRVLLVIFALCGFAFGGVVGQIARRRALAELRSAAWSSDAVTIVYGRGSTVLAILWVLIGLGIAAIVMVLLQRRLIAAVGTTAMPRLGTVLVAGVCVLFVVGAGLAWVTTSADEAVRATSVADFLRDNGESVSAEITSGESNVVRPGGGGGPTLTPPIVLDFDLNGTLCTIVIDDPVPRSDGTVTLTPRCF